MIEAKCNCGAVQLQCSADPVVQLVCHCNDCRDWTGQGFAQLVFLPEQQCSITGQLQHIEYTAKSGNATSRASCAVCATPMFDRSEGFKGLLGVIAQQLASVLQLPLYAHVWTRSALPESVIDASARTYAEGLE